MRFCGRADSQDDHFSLFRRIFVRVFFLVDERPRDSDVLVGVDRIFMMHGVGEGNVSVFF